MAPTPRDGGVRCAFPSQDLLGETPLWCVETQSLLWLDIDNGRLQRWHPTSGRHDVFTFGAGYAGTLALTRDPGCVLLGLDLALHLFHLGTGEQNLLCQVEPPERDNRLNDGRCDAKGRLWVGTMDNQLHRPNGSFYRIDPTGAVERQFDGVIVSNTVALSPTQDTLYFSDTRRFTTWQFSFDLGRGALSDRKTLTDHSVARVRPDGACVDAEGFIWVAHFGSGRPPCTIWSR